MMTKLHFVRAMAGLLLGCLGCCLPVQSQNRNPSFDPAGLHRANFYDTLEPLARREGKLVLYNFAGNFDPIWKTELIPRFEARYGVKVGYHNVRLDQANQQLMAVHQQGLSSPADVYFAGGSNNYDALKKAGAISPINLSNLLPNLQVVPTQYKDIVFGVDTGGSWPMVHLNQMVLAYDSASVSSAELPKTFEALLAWARKNPKKFALTSPAKGGSGSGFLYAAALYFVSDTGCKKMLLDHQLTEQQAFQWASKASCLSPLWDYLAALLRVSELSNGNADTLNLLNNKQAFIGTTWEDLLVNFVTRQQLPETMRSTLLQPGLIHSGDGLILTANAKSPAAALLFIDMAFSKEFQAKKMHSYASRSARSDLTMSSTATASSPYLVPHAQIMAWSVPANWTVTRSLTKAFDDKVLNKF